MNVTDQIYERVKLFPEPAAREVLDFVEFLAIRHAHAETRNLMAAQSASAAMREWDNARDEIWNDRPAV